MFPPTNIPKGIPMKTSTSSSAWGKASKKPIDLIGNEYILAIANSDLILMKFTTGA